VQVRRISGYRCLAVRATNGSGGTGGDVGVAVGACAVGGAGIYGAAQTSQTGPIIAGIVAIIVALVTWYATDRRQAKSIDAQQEAQDRDLEAEQRRHEATLAGERERLDDRLQHERKLADIAEVRKILEHAFDAVDELMRAAGDVVISNDAWSVEHVLEQIVPRYWALNSGANALSIRLARDHGILRAHRALLDTCDGVLDACTAHDETALNAAAKAVGEARRKLTEAAKEPLRSQLD
jgi:hypothetical protein